MKQTQQPHTTNKADPTRRKK